jgi:hypothetical protein
MISEPCGGRKKGAPQQQEVIKPIAVEGVGCSRMISEFCRKPAKAGTH